MVYGERVWVSWEVLWGSGLDSKLWGSGGLGFGGKWGDGGRDSIKELGNGLEEEASGMSRDKFIKDEFNATFTDLTGRTHWKENTSLRRERESIEDCLDLSRILQDQVQRSKEVNSRWN
ncbi:hypothetical protein Tco_1247282 [Tanacetum coccineum]